MTDNSNFLALVQASPTLTERMVRVSAEVVQSARELFGISLEASEVASLVSVRASVLGDMPLADFMEELQGLDKVKARAGVVKPAVNKTLEDTTLGGARDAMARLNAARAGTSQTGRETPCDPAKASDVEKIRYLMTVKSPGLKIELARKWGLQ